MLGGGAKAAAGGVSEPDSGGGGRRAARGDDGRRGPSAGPLAQSARAFFFKFREENCIEKKLKLRKI